MSISVRKVPGNDAARIFIIDGKKSIFPPNDSHVFTSAATANKAGYFIAGKALTNALTTSVTVMNTDSLPGYTGQLRDCIQIELKSASMWSGKVKGSETETIETRYASVLEREFIRGASVAYQKPVSPGQQSSEDLEILNEVKGFLKEKLNNAAKTNDDLTKRVKAGYRGSAFDTINIHGGNITAIAYHNGILKAAFSDTCGGSGCYNNSTLATEAGVTPVILQEFPFIKQIAYVQQ